jgi:hypothetical protein
MPMEAIYLLIGGVIGFLSSVLSEPVRDYFFGPKIQVEFDPKKEGFVTSTCVESSSGVKNAKYIRILVTNEYKRIARQCRAYLVNLESWDPKLKKFVSTIYCDALQLPWSASRDGHASIDIPKNVHRFVDLISTQENKFTPKIHYDVELFRYRSLFLASERKYRYTVLITGDNFDPQSICVECEWGNSWDQFIVSKV